MTNHSIKIQLITVTAILLIGTIAHARPVSYPGGWTVMTMNDYDMNTLHVHYSPTFRYSVGYEIGNWRDANYQTHALKVNNLLRRWNNPDSQGNLYLKSGAGLAYDKNRDSSDDVEPFAFTGMAADWENRRFFAQYVNHFHYTGDIANEEYTQKMRFGVTPYIGEYGDLHTWLMLRIDHNPEDQDNIVLVPHVRLFKGEYMLELGYSDNDEILANFVIRF